MDDDAGVAGAPSVRGRRRCKLISCSSASPETNTQASRV